MSAASPRSVGDDFQPPGQAIVRRDAGPREHREHGGEEGEVKGRAGGMRCMVRACAGRGNAAAFGIGTHRRRARLGRMEIPAAPDITATAAPGKNDRTWAMFAHLSTFAGHLIPFGNIAGPLIIWAIKKDEMPFVNDQGKEAVNFQITMTIALIVSALSLLVLVGFILLPVVYVFDLIVTIIAAIKANEGVAYRYPLCIRFL